MTESTTHIWRDFKLALSQLTLVPIETPWPEGGARGVSSLYPAVGLLLGLDATITLAIVNWASQTWGDGGWLSRGSLAFAAFVVAIWAIETRFLHWDGLADSADALWGGRTRERRIEILADSRVGAFGVVAVVLAAIVSVASLATVLSQPTVLGWSVLAVPVLGRFAATMGAWLGTPLKQTGLGASMLGRPDGVGIVAAFGAVAAGLAPLLIECGTRGAIWAALAIAVAAVVPHLLAQAFEGVNGDILGAGIVLTETVLLALAALVTAW